jgi:hypothetical protein
VGCSADTRIGSGLMTSDLPTRQGPLSKNHRPGAAFCQRPTAVDAVSHLYSIQNRIALGAFEHCPELGAVGRYP